MTRGRIGHLLTGPAVLYHSYSLHSPETYVHRSHHLSPMDMYVRPAQAACTTLTPHASHHHPPPKALPLAGRLWVRVRWAVVPGGLNQVISDLEPLPPRSEQVEEVELKPPPGNPHLCGFRHSPGQVQVSPLLCHPPHLL